MNNENSNYDNQQQSGYGYERHSSYNNYGQGPPQQWQSAPPNQVWPPYTSYPQDRPPQQYQGYQPGPPPQQFENYHKGPLPPQQYPSYPVQDNQPYMPPGEGSIGHRGILEHIPFTAQHAQHEAQKQRYPLAALLNKEGTHISLNIVDAGEDVDQLIPTAQASTSFKPAYTVRYKVNKFSGQVSGSSPPDFDPDKQRVVGSWKAHTFHSEKLKFEFPWGKWGLDPEKQRWLSDVKLLGGNSEMEWVLTDESGGRISDSNGMVHVNFTLRCVDMSDSEKRVVSLVKVKSYASATIEIPVKIIADKEQLDELIVVSLAVMDRQRDEMIISF